MDTKSDSGSMAISETTPVTIKDNDSKAREGEMLTTQFEQGDRVKRALLKLGLFWLLAAGSIPIIFAHWVLVPGFFIAGPFMAIRAYKVTQQSEQVSGVCPACEVNVSIKLEADDELPKWTYCPACNAPLHITQPEN